MKIVILTATYNRGNILYKLRESLRKQLDKDFTWLIIDDGSIDNTHKIIESWEKDSFIRIFLRKPNSGKSRSLNYAFDYLQKNGYKSSFVVIVDDDEILYETAIQTVKKYAVKYYDTKCIGMEFLRNNFDQTPISNYPITNDFYMTVCERKKRKMEIDGYMAYYMEKLSNARFPEFEGEKYVGPGVLQMQIDGPMRILWPNTALGETEYREDGITKQGRKLRLKNPRGMLEYCKLLQNKEAGVIVRAKYSIMGFAYYYYACYTSGKKRDKSQLQGLMKIMNFPGWLLARAWRYKYGTVL